MNAGVRPLRFRALGLAGRPAGVLAERLEPFAQVRRRRPRGELLRERDDRTRVEVDVRHIRDAHEVEDAADAVLRRVQQQAAAIVEPTRD